MTLSLVAHEDTFSLFPIKRCWRIKFFIVIMTKYLNLSPKCLMGKGFPSELPSEPSCCPSWQLMEQCSNFLPIGTDFFRHRHLLHVFIIQSLLPSTDNQRVLFFKEGIMVKKKNNNPPKHPRNQKRKLLSKSLHWNHRYRENQEGKIHDISPTGFFLEPFGPMPRNIWADEVIWIEPKIGNKSYYLSAIVRWRGGHTKGHAQGFGLEFDDCSKKIAKALDFS